MISVISQWRDHQCIKFFSSQNSASSQSTATFLISSIEFIHRSVLVLDQSQIWWWSNFGTIAFLFNSPVPIAGYTQSSGTGELSCHYILSWSYILEPVLKTSSDKSNVSHSQIAASTKSLPLLLKNCLATSLLKPVGDEIGFHQHFVVFRLWIISYDALKTFFWLYPQVQTFVEKYNLSKTINFMNLIILSFWWLHRCWWRILSPR